MRGGGQGGGVGGVGGVELGWGVGFVELESVGVLVGGAVRCGAVRCGWRWQGGGGKGRGRRYFEDVALVRVGGEVGAREHDLVFEAGVVVVEVVAFCSVDGSQLTKGADSLVKWDGMGVSWRESAVGGGGGGNGPAWISSLNALQPFANAFAEGWVSGCGVIDV